MENNRPLGWTTLEEAKKLVEAGLDPNTADMSYNWVICKVINGNPREDWLLQPYPIDDNQPHEQVPCWSLGTLLELIPKLVGERNSSLLYNANFNFELSPRYKYPLRWVARYSGMIQQKDNEGDFHGQTLFSNDVSTEFTYGNAIETICDTIVWLLENGYMEKHGIKL